MAVFMVNVCKFSGCGLVFPTLGDLIRHIEETHIDTDPVTLEEKEASQPSCIHLSYVLRYNSETCKPESPLLSSEIHRKLPPIATIPSYRSITPTGSEIDDEDVYSARSDDSNTSWATTEEFSPDFILRHGSRMSNSNGQSEKPFACPVPGCFKRYKNVNGIKYHAKNGHKNDGKIKKDHKCQCGKSYKTFQRLRNHLVSQHSVQTPSPSPSSRVPQSPTPPLVSSQPMKPVSLPVMKALQGIVGLPHNHLPTGFNNSRIKTMSQIQNVPEIENTRTIRAILENSKKLSKDNVRSIGSLKPNFNYMQTNSVSPSSLSVVQRLKYDTDVSNSRVSSQCQIDNEASSLGILTPASSPNSTACEKTVCLSEDEKSSVCERRSVSLSVNEPSLPLTPVTPKHDSQVNFSIVDGIFTN